MIASLTMTTSSTTATTNLPAVAAEAAAVEPEADGQFSPQINYQISNWQLYRWFSNWPKKSTVKEEPVDDDVEEEEEAAEEEVRIPGMPSKPCPQCKERFTTREGFLDHITGY